MNHNRNRYTHEKKLVMFMMNTCKALRTLSKQKDTLGSIVNHCLMAGIVLLRKTERLNEVCLNSLAKSQNLYNLKHFDKFATSEDSKKIRVTLGKDAKLYATLLDHMKKRADEEVSSNA